jgi:hypothetical protein
MNLTRQTRFIDSAAVILFVMAASQIFATTGVPPLLNHSDTLLGLSLRQVFYGVAGAELALSAYLLAGKNSGFKLAFIAWLILNLIIYQGWLWGSGLPNYLCCLGNLNDNFPLPPRVLNWIALVCSGYCLLGSCVFMVWNWWDNRKPAGKKRIAAAPQEGEQIQTV